MPHRLRQDPKPSESLSPREPKCTRSPRRPLHHTHHTHPEPRGTLPTPSPRRRSPPASSPARPTPRDPNSSRVRRTPVPKRPHEHQFPTERMIPTEPTTPQWPNERLIPRCTIGHQFPFRPLRREAEHRFLADHHRGPELPRGAHRRMHRHAMHSHRHCWVTLSARPCDGPHAPLRPRDLPQRSRPHAPQRLHQVLPPQDRPHRHECVRRAPKPP